MIIFFRNRKNTEGLWKGSRFGIKCFMIMICIGCFFISCMDGQTTAFAEESLNMYAGSYALIDGTTGRLLTGKEETVPMANASTTKILTCIVTLENADLSDMVTISANAASQPKVRLGMKEGEQYPLNDLLYGLMLESYNDCAVAIAEHLAGSVEEFAQMMNRKAKEIGCQDTYFITPNGLDSENESGFHHTTAWDLCRIMAYCTWKSPMQEQFLQITQTRNFSGSANGTEYSFVNRNAFLDQMEGVLSGKTGFTSKAGYCYVAALEQDGEKYCISLLACGWPNNKNYKWHDARILFTYGLDHYNVRKIETERITKQIEVDGYVGESAFWQMNSEQSLEAEADSRTYELLLTEQEELTQEVILYTDIELPIVKGQELGVCNIYLEEEKIDSFPLVAADGADTWNLEKIMEVIFCQFLTFSS